MRKQTSLRGRELAPLMGSMLLFFGCGSVSGDPAAVVDAGHEVAAAVDAGRAADLAPPAVDGAAEMTVAAADAGGETIPPPAPDASDSRAMLPEAAPEVAQVDGGSDASADVLPVMMCTGGELFTVSQCANDCTRALCITTPQGAYKAEQWYGCTKRGFPCPGSAAVVDVACVLSCP